MDDDGTHWKLERKEKQPAVRASRKHPVLDPLM
jgi:hypothetical protein